MNAHYTQHNHSVQIIIHPLVHEHCKKYQIVENIIDTAKLRISLLLIRAHIAVATLEMNTKILYCYHEIIDFVHTLMCNAREHNTIM